MMYRRQMHRAGDHRTIVVPTITALNPDTWEENAGAASTACFLSREISHPCIRTSRSSLISFQVASYSNFEDVSKIHRYQNIPGT